MSYNISRHRNKKYGKKSKKKNYIMNKRGGDPTEIDYKTILNIGDVLYEKKPNQKKVKIINKSSCVEYLFDILHLEENLLSNWKNTVDAGGQNIWENMKTKKILNHSPKINTRNILENLILDLDNNTNKTLPYSIIFFMSQFIDVSKVNSSIQSKINLVKSFFTNNINYFENLLFNNYLKSHHFYNNNKINNFTLHNDMNNYNDVYTKSYSNASTIKTLLKTLLNYSKTSSNSFFLNEIVYNSKNSIYKISGIERNIFSEFITYNYQKRSSIQTIKETMHKLIVIYSKMPSLFNTKAFALLDGNKFNLSKIDLRYFDTEKLMKIDYAAKFVLNNDDNRDFIHKNWNLNIDILAHKLDFNKSDFFLDTLIADIGDDLHLTTFITEPTDTEIYTFIENNKQQINDMIIKNKEMYDMTRYIKKNKSLNSKQSILLENYIKYVNSESYITELLVKNKIISDNLSENEPVGSIRPIDNVLLPLYDINDKDINTKISSMSQINKDIIKKHILNESDKSNARMTLYKQQLNDTYKIDLLQMVEVFNDLTDDTLENLGYTIEKINYIKWYLSITLNYNQRKMPPPILNKKKFGDFKKQFSFLEYYTSKTTTIETKMRIMYIDYFKKEETNYIETLSINKDNIYEYYCLGVAEYNKLNYNQSFLIFNYLYNKPDYTFFGNSNLMKAKCSFYLYNIYLQEFYYHQDCKQLQYETSDINTNCTYYIHFIKENISNIDNYILHLINKKLLKNYIDLPRLNLLSTYKDTKTKVELELKQLQKKNKGKPITAQSQVEIDNAQQKLDNINKQISDTINLLNADNTKINKTDSLDILLLALYYLFKEEPSIYCLEFLNKLRLSNNYDRLLFLKFLHLFTDESMIKKFKYARILTLLKQFLDEQLLFVKPHEEIIYNNRFEEQNKNVNILLYKKINFALFFIHKYEKNFDKCNENQIEITIYSFFIPAELCIMYLDRDIPPKIDNKGNVVDKFIQIDSIVQFKPAIHSAILNSSKDEFADKKYLIIKLEKDETNIIDYNHRYSFVHIDKYPPKCSDSNCPCNISGLLHYFQYVCSKQYYETYIPNTIYTLTDLKIKGQIDKVIDDSYIDLRNFKENNIELIRPTYNIKISDEDKRDNYDIEIDFNDKGYKYITEENISKLYLFKIFNDYRNYAYNFSPNSKINNFEYDILDNFFLDMFNEELQESKYIINCLKKMNFDIDSIDTIVHMYSNITDTNKKAPKIHKFLTISLDEPGWKYINEQNEIFFSPSISSRIEDAFKIDMTNFKLLDVNLEFDLSLNIVYKIPDKPSNLLRVITDKNILNTAISINNDVKYRKLKLIENLPDGNCLFHSLSEVLKKDFTILRYEIANFVRIHYNDKINSLNKNVNTTYKELIELKNNSKPITMDEYFNHMNTPKIYGTDIEIMAASELYNINIYIINSAGLNLDQYYIGNRIDELHNNVIFLYNDNLIHYRLAIIERFNISRVIMNDPTKILDINKIDFDTLSIGEKCAFITLLSENYITILRMLEIKDVTKSIRVHGKQRVFINVSDYINKLKNILQKFVIDYKDSLIDRSDYNIPDMVYIPSLMHQMDIIELFNKQKKQKKEDDIVNTIIDMKSLIISTFDDESLAYFIILHCFLFKLYNPPSPTEQSESYKDYLLWYNNRTAYTFHTFLNSKINDSTILVSEFIKTNDHNLDNLKIICKNTNNTNLDNPKSSVDEPKSWTYYIVNLLYLGSDLYKAFNPRVIEFVPQGILERAALYDKFNDKLIDARINLGLNLDGEEDHLAKIKFRELAKAYHPDKSQLQGFSIEEAKIREKMIGEKFAPARDFIQEFRKRNPLHFWSGEKKQEPVAAAAAAAAAAASLLQEDFDNVYITLDGF